MDFHQLYKTETPTKVCKNRVMQSDFKMSCPRRTRLNRRFVKRVPRWQTLLWLRSNQRDRTSDRTKVATKLNTTDNAIGQLRYPYLDISDLQNWGTRTTTFNKYTTQSLLSTKRRWLHNFSFGWDKELKFGYVIVWSYLWWFWLVFQMLLWF